MMKHNRTLETPNQTRQRGSTLIVSLIMLLLISLIAVGGMQDTILQERMTSNSQGRGMAFEAAEAALREGESDVDGGAAGGANRIDPMGDWSSFTTTSMTKVDSRAADDPQYHLSPLRCPELAEGGCPVEIFDVTARGVGERSSTITILRTAYGRVN